jgi:hypothetical protein
MNRYLLLCVCSIFCLTTTFIAPLAHGEVPRGWIVAGDHPKDFEFSLDARETHQQHPSALIAARPGVISNGFGTLMQSINAENYRGTRLSLSGYLKTQDAGRAQLWMRVDGSDRRVLSFDNMDDRPVVGTTDWSRYQIVLDVPQDSRAIAFGFLLVQKGKAWGGNFKLEKVDAALAVTSAAPVTLAKEPTNLDFTGASVHPASTTTASYKPETVRVYDLYRGEPEGAFNRARIQATDAGAGQFYRADKYNLCGMHVVGTTDNDHHPALRWDLKLSVFVRDGARVAGIAAGTFTMQPHAEKPLPRPAISRLEIRLEGEHTSAVADLTTQNADHGVSGFFPEAHAEKLFDAFDAGEPFTLNVTLDSGESESVLMQTRRGTLDPSSSYRGGGAPMKRCLTSLVSPTDDGLRQRLIELEHPW